MTHFKEYTDSSSKQLLISYFVDGYFIMDNEEDECFIELDNNSNSLLNIITPKVFIVTKEMSALFL